MGSSLSEYIHEVTCTEGKNRQIRNVFAALGCKSHIFTYIIEEGVPINDNMYQMLVYANEISTTVDSSYFTTT